MTPSPSPTSRKEPFGALAHARLCGAAGLRRSLIWLMLRHLGRLGIAGALSLLVGHMTMDGRLATVPLAAAMAAMVAVSLAGLQTERVQATAEAHVAVSLRKAAGERLRAMPASTIRALSPGAVAVSMQRHPDAVAKLVIGHRAASLMLASGPLAAAGALAIVSWPAALLVLALTPVMIVFFVLVGETIRARAETQERAFSHLAGQFADRIRTLPTILAHHALASEEAKLAGRLDTYASKTMGVLRIAFLNAALIDFFTSLSIAMLAVFLGLGHLKLVTIPGFSGLALWQSLFILMVASEYFAPFRRFSELYHAKAEGQVAAAALDRILDTEPQALPALPAIDQALSMLALPGRGLVVLTGPSGAGKSTLLRRIAGIEHGTPPHPALAGGCIWISTEAFVSGATLAEAIGHRAGVDKARLREAAERVRLLDDALLPGGLDAALQVGGANLSGGQRLRIATAGAWLAAGAVIADEPTAKLDSEAAQSVRDTLVEIARTRLVVAASHDRKLIALANLRIDLAEPASEDLETAA